MEYEMILGQKTKPPSIENGVDVPSTCAVCARRSYALAYCPDTYGRKEWMWICDDCTQHAKVIYMLKPKQLDKLEQFAICRATEETRTETFQALFMAAYNAGVDRISEITPELMDKIVEDATISGDLIIVHQKWLLAYGAKLKEAVKEEIPF